MGGLQAMPWLVLMAVSQAVGVAGCTAALLIHEICRLRAVAQCLAAPEGRTVELRVHRMAYSLSVGEGTTRSNA